MLRNAGGARWWGEVPLMGGSPTLAGIVGWGDVLVVASSSSEDSWLVSPLRKWDSAPRSRDGGVLALPTPPHPQIYTPTKKIKIYTVTKKNKKQDAKYTHQRKKIKSKMPNI